MDELWQDLRYAVRLFAKSPGFTFVAVVVLALGIGANTAIFSLVNAALLRPLSGVSNPDELVLLERTLNGHASSSGYPDYVDYRDNNRTLAGLAAHCGTPLTFDNGMAERLRGDLVTGNYFNVLGVKAALGRLITPDDDTEPGANPIAVLSYGFWLRDFGGASDVTGRTIRLNDYDFTIIGVAARDFAGSEKGSSFDVWIPINMQAQAMPRTMGRVWFNDRSAGWLTLFGRLKPGVSLDRAQAELATTAKQLEQSYPNMNSGGSLVLLAGLGLDSEDRTSLRNFLRLLAAAVVLLLLIACTNVANLLLVRATARRREIAVKLALGATRGRLVRQLLTEGILLSLAGGSLGVLLAPWVAGLILTFQQPAYALRGMDVSLDGRVLAFTALLSVLTGVVFGLVPALQASNPDLVTSLKEGSPGSGGSKSRLQGRLVVAQLALSLLLLIGAGLAVRTMQKVLTMDRGFDSDNLVLMSMDLTIRHYSESTGRSFYEDLINRVEAIPGVVSASLAKTVPPNDWSDRLNVFLPGDEPPPDVLRTRDDLGLRVDANRIAPHYFRTLGIPIVEGREFNYSDRLGAAPVAIVSQKLAERLWPGENAIGKQLSVPFWHEPRPPVEIVGVAKNTRYRSLLADVPMLVYLPELQTYDGRATLVVRVASNPSSSIPAIRGEVAAVDKTLPVFAVKTMSEQIAATLWQQRMLVGLVGLFGALALVMAAIGLYGIMAHWVALKTREIGIRMALGARPSDVKQMVVRQGFWLAVQGIALGLVSAFALTRLMSSLLYGISATDPLTFVAASVLLAGVALGASFAPARRATKVDPMIALRCE
ncbi:MAG TPA: ABC transporter permease [Blastocatellia bacterium]|nr:ABC transporter permease [Blastocatellia bacterium]